MTAFLMAVRINDMNREETVQLTKSMLESGDIFSWSETFGSVVDKHSTGGVGDKVSIPLAPLAAATGLKVPMISGRGLGHTGGTLDKLESIPGFQTRLAPEILESQLKEIGNFMMGQTEGIAPADKRMYALRDVTATVESIPLITSSILSKKLAAGLDALVLDVKVGSGSFMKSFVKAKALAGSLVQVGNALGLKTSALLTNMDEPLGWTAGNRVEIEESIELLDPSIDSSHIDDLRVLVIELTAMMIVNGGLVPDLKKARVLANEKLDDGTAWTVFKSMVEAQGGRLDEFVAGSPTPSHQYLASKSGYIDRIDAENIGLAALHTGAGRTFAEQDVDPDAGIRFHKRSGDEVEKGEAIASLYMGNQGSKEQVYAYMEKAIEYTSEEPEMTDLIDTLFLGRL